MLAAGKNADLVGEYLIDEPVFLVNAARPASRKFVSQRLWLAKPRKRLSLHLPHKADDAEGLRAILFNPPGQILEGGGIKFQASQARPREQSRPGV